MTAFGGPINVGSGNIKDVTVLATDARSDVGRTKEVQVTRRSAFLLLFVCVPFLQTSDAHEIQYAGVTVKHPWVRTAPAGSASTVAAGKIINQGKEADRLIGASLEGAGTVELYRQGSNKGVPLTKAGLAIGPGETVVLSTDGTHLRFTGLSKSLDEDTYVDGTLIFEKAGNMTIEFYVEPLPSDAAQRPIHSRDNTVTGKPH